MLRKLLLEESLPETQPAVVTRERTVDWGELRAMAQAFLASHGDLAQRRVGLAFRSPAVAYAALAALDRLQCDVFLLDGARPVADLEEAAGRLRVGALVLADDGGIEVHALENEEVWSGASSVTILTSGSAGQPKAARHSWESMERPVRNLAHANAPVWMLTYLPHLYAGLQVMLQCFADRGTLVVVSRDSDPQATADYMLAKGVQFASATASYWRRLLLFANHEILKQIPLQQITLGGEVVDQGILDRLRACFPGTRVVHIYATTELGRCFSVSDGGAGFPASYLETGVPGGVELKIVDGELLVRSANSMSRYDQLSSEQGTMGEWFPTGDLVEVKEDRAFFVGRRTDLINVAGSKVYPLEVERVIRAVAGVSDVRVFGKRSSIAGELVACEIVAADGEDAASLKERVMQHCRVSLTGYQQPRLVKMVERLDLSSAGKTLRTKA